MAQVRGMPHTLSSTLREYCESTTIHGFAYCITAGKILVIFLNDTFQIFDFQTISITVSAGYYLYWSHFSVPLCC